MLNRRFTFAPWFFAFMLAVSPTLSWAQSQDQTAEQDSAVAQPEAPVGESTEDQSGEQASESGEEPTAQTDEQAQSSGHVVGWLELTGSLREGPIPFAWLGSEDVEPSLRDVLQQLETVEKGDQYQGIVVYLDQAILGPTQAMAIADAMKRVSDAGKKVLTFSEAYDTQGYLLASNADLILLQRKGTVQLNGLAVEEMYLSGLLEKIGVTADLLQVGKFKGADETFTRSEPSEAWSENMDGLLDDMYNQIVTRIGNGRGLDKSGVERLIADSWTLTDQQLLTRNAVDRIADRDLINVTEVEFGDRFAWDDSMGRTTTASAQANNPFGFFQMLFQQSEIRTTRPTIALIHAAGPITSGDSSIGDGVLSSNSIGSRTMVQALGIARDDPNIKGVVIRMDSPGGSALASEVIWQAVREVGETKPVYASVGGMAASGGYYIVCAADKIYTEPSSILGSIGVVGGKLTLGGLYEKLGVSVTRRSRGPMADMFNSVEPFNEKQREMMNTALEQTYDQFTDRVKTGRGSRLEEIEEVAKGRIFTGQQSANNGLADEIGGLDQTIDAMAEQLSLTEGQFDTVYLPPPASLQQYLNAMFGGSGQAKASAPAAMLDPSSRSILITARQLMGRPAWESARRVMVGLFQLRDESVLAITPAAIVVR